MSPSASTGPAGVPRKPRAAGVAARVRHALAWRTRLPRALKAALAATLAWLVVQPLGGPADQYAYYAPLGAVIAVSVTVADSASAAAQGVAAILLGAALAVLAVELVPGTLAGLAAVVLLGTVLAGWWRLGDMGSWVPIAALFVLTVGSSGLVDYLVGYVVLTGLGTLVGVAVSAVLPPMPLVPGDREIAAARSRLAGQLDALADGLRSEPPLGPREWSERHHDVRPQTRAMDRLVIRAAQARRGNWRARRRDGWADRQVEHARALARLSFVVDDLAAMLTSMEQRERGSTALGPRLRRPAAEALEAAAAMLRDGAEAGGAPSPSSVERACDAVEELARLVGESIRDLDDEAFTAAGVVTGLRRLVAST